MKYQILEITEEDYGCEGIPENGELMCSIFVLSEDGEKKWFKVPDRILRERCIDVGCIVKYEDLTYEKNN